MNWLSILGIFAKPLGAAINNGIAAASGAALVWATQHHVDAGVAAPIISAVALAVSTTISGLAATQGVQIPIINKDATNGVKVVASNASAPAVNSPLPKAP